MQTLEVRQKAPLRVCLGVYCGQVHLLAEHTAQDRLQPADTNDRQLKLILLNLISSAQVHHVLQADL